MWELVWVGSGGFFGAISRYALGNWIASRLGTAFPYGTLLINLTGCLALGFFGTLALRRATLIPPEARLLVAVGFLGAYTTFSTFGFETIRLLEENNLALAFAYVLGSVLAGLLTTYLGVVAARALG
ncbi:MAG TPA: fluoride efflux transporter CrcB [Pantanalinema sp.]